jgi:leader peptidase (prepilin peptidase)/N-methyltransferase
MPRDLSVIHPPSHCPKCNYSIPWFLNIPIITWLTLRGKCRNCDQPISVRYLLVEVFTGITFATAWWFIAPRSVGLALVYCVILSAFIVATLIDIEHFIIPDEITIGGIFAGFIFSALVPQLHNTVSRPEALRASFWGIVVGGGLVYLILRAGKVAFGKEKLELAPDSKITFTETSLQLPDKALPYEEIFYRKSDYIKLHAKTVEVRFARQNEPSQNIDPLTDPAAATDTINAAEPSGDNESSTTVEAIATATTPTPTVDSSELDDRCYFNTLIILTPDQLKIGDETFNPEQVPHMEVVASEVILPREAMGFGDVKFMAAIGAFLGWQAAIFSLMFSAVIGTIVSVSFIALRRSEWSAHIPYGPYIALAAIIYMFLPPDLQNSWRNYLSVFTQILPWSKPTPFNA